MHALSPFPYYIFYSHSIFSFKFVPLIISSTTAYSLQPTAQWSYLLSGPVIMILLELMHAYYEIRTTLPAQKEKTSWIFAKQILTMIFFLHRQRTCCYICVTVALQKQKNVKFIVLVLHHMFMEIILQLKPSSNSTANNLTDHQYI